MAIDDNVYGFGDGSSGGSNAGFSLAAPGGQMTGVGGTQSALAGGYGSVDALSNANNAYANRINTDIANENSMWGKGGSVDQGLGMAGKAISGISSLANIYLGFQNLSMAKDELKIKKDQWKESKAELNHMRATRARIGQSYTTGSAMAR